MPAEFMETPFGVGISFPKTPALRDATKGWLKERGYRKASSIMNHYLIEDNPLNRIEAKEFVQRYNQVHYE